MNPDDLPLSTPELPASQSPEIVEEVAPAEIPPDAWGDPSTNSAPPQEPAAPSSLEDFVRQSQHGRMSPAAETQASELLRDALLGGRAEIDLALQAIVLLPWPISVNALNAAWPAMKPYGRRLFVTGMKAGRFEGEIGRRIRLSLTRGLAKVDEPQAARWACAIAHEMLGPEGTLAVRDRQSFFNVFIGKGKPWLLRLPLVALKEADVRDFFICAVITVFGGGCPPYTQSSLLQWMLHSGKIESLDEKNLQLIAQTVRRWPGRLFRDFNQTGEMPPLLAEVFQKKSERKTDETAHTETAVEQIPAEKDEKDQPVDEAGKDLRVEPQAEREDRPRDQDAEEDENDDDDDEDDEEDDDLDENEETASREPERAPYQRPVRPPYVSPGQASRPTSQNRNAPAASNSPRELQNFDPVAALRQLDQFVRQQSQQLQQTRTALRQREDELKRGGGSRGASERPMRGRRGRERYGSDSVWPETAPSEDAESLRRLVGQLEAANTELRVCLEDLATDGEQKAESLTASDGSPLSERDQLCHFLSAKLSKDFADFKRLEKEPADEVFRDHYRIVLDSVFAILASEGIVPTAPES